MKISLFLMLLISLTVFAKDILVMEVDTGVDTSHIMIKERIIQSSSDELVDRNGHGTHIAGIILKGTCEEVKLISCKYYYSVLDFGKKNTPNDCFQRAIDLNVDYINFSSGGNGQNVKEKELFELATSEGIIITVAAGNDNASNPEYYPAKYRIKGLITIGNLDPDGKRHFLSNYGFKEMKWEIGTGIKSTLPDGKFGYMSGTSQATAVHLNRLLKAKCLKLK